MKNKKAIALTTLVLMLIVVAVAIVLMRGTLRAEEEIKELSHVEACRQSITVISEATEKSAGFLPILRINCPAPHQNLTNQEEYLDVLDIATEVSNCFYKTAGEQNRLGSNYALFMDWLSGDDDICVVCSTFEVDKEIFSSELIKYLEEKKIKATSWDNEHIFIHIREDSCAIINEVRPASPYCYTRAFENWGAVPSIVPMTKLEPGKKYYVMSINAAHSQSKEFNGVFVLAEEQLDIIKCDGDVIFYQKA